MTELELLKRAVNNNVDDEFLLDYLAHCTDNERTGHVSVTIAWRPLGNNEPLVVLDRDTFSNAIDGRPCETAIINAGSNVFPIDGWNVAIPESIAKSLIN